MEDHVLLFVVSSLIAFLFLPIAFYLLLRSVSLHRLNGNYFFYMYAIFTFTAVVDFLLGCTLDGRSNIGRFYLEEGERYLRTAHGMWINYYDGTVHLVCYLFLIFRSLSSSSPSSSDHSIYLLTLFWFGSIMNSLIVFLPGNVVGIFATELRSSYLLNLPYLLFPLLHLRRTLHGKHEFQQHIALRRQIQLLQQNERGNEPQQKQRADEAKVGSDGEQEQEEAEVRSSCLKPNASIFHRPVDMVIVLYLCVTLVIYTWRFLCACQSPHPLIQSYLNNVEPYLTSSTQYPQLQAIAHFMYGVPFTLYCLDAFLSSSSSAASSFHSYLPELVTLNAGAALQGVGVYVLSCVHGGTYMKEPWFSKAAGGRVYPVTSEAEVVFWGVNLLLLLGPQLLWLRVCGSDRALTSFFGGASTISTANTAVKPKTS